MRNDVYVRALRRAADILGGVHQLRAYLRVAILDLQAWMDGAQKPPTDIFLKVVDIISGQAGDVAELLRRSREGRFKAGEIGSAAQAVRDRATEVMKRAAAVRQRSSELCAALIKGRIAKAASHPEISAIDFISKEFAASEGARVLETALNAAVNATAAERANIQLGHDGGLSIVAHLGFERPFLQFFDTVSHNTPSTCGRAYEAGQRIIVADVANDPIFAGTVAGEVMLEAGALAVQSTPLIRGSGEVIGMLSTHYERPHQPSPEELATLDLIGERTSFWLAGHRPLAG